ncbi:3-keto-disaccharide hydrolase [Chthonomonas calidirosea]|uniref:3-keto-disaccharide hydrolase n=1 Tax=Chthonomonas calidirosea TaxID=454171 RepID=UPI0006ECB563|nr:DUF1080 domain-containing protein [Chthonomonas calidirosea]CEK13288.1 protein of unknown function (DUF1080) [Chthonomonas calidirosea]
MNKTQLVHVGLRLLSPALLCGLFLATMHAHSLPKQTPETAPKPVESPPVPPPPGAKNVVYLFTGKPNEIAENWVYRGSHQPAQWIFDHGTMRPRGGDIISKQTFTDFHLHVEFWEPYMPNAHGQERGNSGVAPYGLYEIQVLDSYGIPDPGTGDCGAVYGQTAPLLNACKPPLQWQTYDIIFRAPRWDTNGKKIEDARVTVLQNGIVVQNNTIIPEPTGIAYGRKEHPGPGPILLQDHGSPVRFRNVWVIPLPEHGATHY